MLAALFSMPLLIEAMGLARFGVLSLAWVIVGYFSMFDLGLGRAITQLIAQKIGKGEEEDIPSLVWIAMGLMVILGIVGALVVALLSPWLAGSMLELPPELASETLSSFFVLAASLPVVIVTTALRGILEARKRFDVVNLVRAPVGVLTYLGPIAVLPFSYSLPPMVAVLVATRLLSCVVYLVISLRLYPELAQRPSYRPKLLRQLLSFGGWMTLSNIAAPLLLYLGRFALATMVSMEAVAYFSTPYDIVINMLIIPGVFVTVMFPIFAEQFPRDQQSVNGLYFRAIRYLLIVMLPLTLLTYLLAESALAWWISAEFSEHSARVAELLAIGIFINSFGHISQSLVQAYGRPDLTAKLHVAELVIYAPYLWWLIEKYGVEGAAVAWVVRVTLSTVALWLMAKGCLSGTIRKGH